MLGLVDALHVEYAGDGSAANAVLPSVIDTPRATAPRCRTPTPRPGCRERLAATLADPRSPGAADTSGAHIPVYGRA